MADNNLILVARVAGAFGVKGEVRLTAYTADPLSLVDYKALVRESGAPGLTVVSGRAAKGALICRVKEVDTREQAEALRGLQLYVPRDALPEPDEDEFYLTDLIGLEIVGEDGQPIGRVKSVQDFGAGDLLEVQPAPNTGKGGATWYLPFTREAVPHVDIAAGRLIAVPPAEVDEAD